MTKEALNKKISEFEEKGQMRSKYYLHLIKRKAELEA
jgi:hypothetical protein